MEIIFNETNNTRKYPLIFTRRNTTYSSKIDELIESTEITGVYPGHNWEVGDVIVSSHPMLPGTSPINPVTLCVSRVIEQRDAKGVYQNGEGENSFFHLELNTPAL